MQHKLDTLTKLAYAAALDAGKWSSFLQACSDLAGGGVRTCLTGYDLDAHIDLGARQFGYDPAFEQTYADYFFERDFLAGRMLSAGAGQLVSYGDVWRDPALRRTEFYDDWVRPQEDITGGCSALLFKQERRLFAFSGSIRAKDTERLEAPWQEIVRHMLPHLQQAFEIARTVAGAEIEKKALVNVVDPASAGCLVVTRSRRIVFANQQAETLLETGDVIRCDLRHRFAFASETWQRHFSAIIAKSDGSFRQPQTFSISNSDGKPSLTCRIAPLATEELEYRPSGILFGNEEPCFLFTLAGRSDSPDVAVLLCETFGLTPNEARVVVHLAGGLSPKEIAELRGTSISTVRNQLHAAMGKMEARRQSDIVGMVTAMRH
ncbi:helix-turn-helix transcriptional regulator [Nitratireductor sp. B36]|uniref:helix-turn-helix transcriptional regulator n=1 Tax=Nitratireductor sp. B36 TaxID=2762059 RepID=UPI001E57D999|nr:helix-turn-helix transcriptional regulator [Nitratireductor sp. B36]